MDSLILRTTTTFLLPLLFLVSIFLLIRGHNEPGGGFVGGLIAAGAFALYAVAFNVSEARQVLRIRPSTAIAVGLLLALGGGLLATAGGSPFLTGMWVTVSIAGLGEIDLGTPLLFDLGVYLVVIGVALNIVLPLLDEPRIWPRS